MSEQEGVKQKATSSWAGRVFLEEGKRGMKEESRGEMVRLDLDLRGFAAGQTCEPTNTWLWCEEESWG